MTQTVNSGQNEQTMRQIGRYRLDHALGSGGFATVWKAYDPELDTTVAVKLLADNWALNADVRERFLSEARLLRRTESRRLVRVHDIGLVDDRPYFVMDFIDGGTLADRIGRLEPHEALRLAAEAAEATHVLHEAGFVHRDIKPGNLLVDQTCEPVRVVVADLGSAKRLADASGFTVTTGTPGYMAPEQLDGTGPIDARTDVYALGVVTWELLTGQRPAPPEPRGRGLLRPQRRRLTAAGSTGVSPAVLSILEAALDPDPGRRPSDAREFARALTAADSSAPPVGRSWPAALVWTAAVTVFVLAAVIGWLVL